MDRINKIQLKTLIWTYELICLGWIRNQLKVTPPLSHVYFEQIKKWSVLRTDHP